MMKKAFKIGIYRNAGASWHGGQIYFQNLIDLLTEEGEGTVELVVIENNRSEAPLLEERPGISQVFLDHYSPAEGADSPGTRQATKRPSGRKGGQPGEGVPARGKNRRRGGRGKASPESSHEYCQRSSRGPREVALETIAREHDIDFIFPLRASSEGASVVGAAWIPDLQHRFLPELFSPEEIAQRDESFRRATAGRAVVFSSESAREDFRQHYPVGEARLEVWRFCGNPSPDALREDPERVVRKYRLPRHFFLVANQFWKHKDHILVIQALARLKAEGLAVPVVFTGALRDYRGSGHIDELLQAIQREGVHDCVHLLGFLDRTEQWQLMRAALGVIHPSRFEGWSTVVEDCKAIGQRLVLSDLAVHLEQAPPHSVYFPVGDAVALAGHLREWATSGAEAWTQGREAREREAIAALRERRAESRRRFLDMAQRLVQEARAGASTRDADAPTFSIITVTRNHADGLRRTLESIAAQTCRNFELLVVDGHSTDETPAVLQDFSSLPMRVLQDRGQGVYAAMNQGVEEARGKWVLFMNAGDCFFDAHTLARFYVPAGFDLVYGRAWPEDRSRAFTYRPFEEIWKGNVFCHQALFARAELLRQFPFRERYRIVADYAFYIDCLQAGYRFAEIDLDVAVIESGGLSQRQLHRRTWERYGIARKVFSDCPVRRYYLRLFLRQLTGGAQGFKKLLRGFRRRLRERRRGTARRGTLS